MAKGANINPHRCPRCDGLRTEFLGNDGTPTTTYLCRDCEKKNPDYCTYDIVRDSNIQSVNWDDPDRQCHSTVYDSFYLTQQAATDMRDLLQEFVTDVEAAGIDVDGPGYDDTQHDWPDLAVTYRKAKALLAQVNGQDQ